MVPRSFFVHSFGCRASQADGAAVETSLAGRGLEPVRCARDAELVILNTCTVTAAADEELRQVIRRVHRENPASQILVTGCYAQRAPREIAALPGVAAVVGNSHKTRIAELVGAGGAEAEAAGGVAPFHGQVWVDDIFAQCEWIGPAVEQPLGDRTRPNLKIQDGCNHRCSFCVIPSVRGRSRSARPDEVVEQVRRLAAGYREIVLTGINLGRWGREPGIQMRLAGLLDRLLRETEVERLRLSSVEPMDFSDDLLELMASTERICRHVHAPLQSGSDAVLRRMRRRYRPWHYESRLRAARRLMPEAAIGADVMVGFPGETEAEFEESRQFIESLPFTYLHVFTYSERPGTAAEHLPGRVPAPVRKERNRILRELAARKNLEFRRALVGATLSAVTLDPPGCAITTNYLKLQLAAPAPPNRLVTARIGGVAPAGLLEEGAVAVEGER